MLLGAIFNCYLKLTVDLSPVKAQSLDSGTQISSPWCWTFQYAFELSVLWMCCNCRRVHGWLVGVEFKKHTHTLKRLGFQQLQQLLHLSLWISFTEIQAAIEQWGTCYKYSYLFWRHFFFKKKGRPCSKEGLAQRPCSKALLLCEGDPFFLCLLLLYQVIAGKEPGESLRWKVQL